jgi:hypothetical protein
LKSWGSEFIASQYSRLQTLKKDRQWIQSVYGEYMDSLADLNTGLFSVLGADNPHEDEIFANWFANDHSHPLLILKGFRSRGLCAGDAPADSRRRRTRGGLSNV